MASMKSFGRALAGAGLLAVAAAAPAAPIITAIGQDAAVAPVSFTFRGVTFTFGATGDPFNPLTVQNSMAGEFGSFGGFLGIPVTPTTSFVDRGTVTFGPNDRFASFPTPTVVPFSLGDNFIGLRATLGAAPDAASFYGFAYTTDTVVNSIGFETVADQTITAVTTVPEPASWALMIAGVGAVGGAARYRRRKAAVAYA